ncbi:methyltransferase domain-containing protein [Planosporangium thailandense]|uniref:Methyltransferase domain-containing protein n=1 Tax=Planosporangium thailandense TaxID=765197 RepID=A0ABX0Y556_9ACTN|nr:class I SAM-dependent methyltransferase [Planosporangium thailandense]NJC73536.1 methyltransferase domain-containing protein [Planosporangium thailandense]
MTEAAFLRTTRAAYDTVAADYAARFGAGLADKPLDRALLSAFAELVRACGDGPVADLGCGPGSVTAHLHALGLTAFGIDLSPQMVAQARRAHPHLRFDVGSMTALDVPDASLSGIVSMYSIIHTPPESLPTVFAEFHRVLAPGGQVLLVFQVRDEPGQRTDWYGHPVSLDTYRQVPDEVADLLSATGLVVHAKLRREPAGDAEKIPRAYLLARKPAAVS